MKTLNVYQKKNSLYFSLEFLNDQELILKKEKLTLNELLLQINELSRQTGKFDIICTALDTDGSILHGESLRNRYATLSPNTGGENIEIE